MADSIVFNYEEMKNAAAAIREIATKYQNTSDTMIQEFTAAVAGWEGESHDKMIQFMNTSVQSYTKETIPQLLEALATLLEANAQQMQSADKQIAESIPGGQA